MNIEFQSVTPDSARWNEWLSLVPHDVYHTAEYHRLAQSAGEGQPFMAVCGTPERFIAWPYLLRPIAGNDRCDITSVYGYAGPVEKCNGDDDEFRRAALGRLAEVWKGQNIVSAFCRMHPVLANSKALASVSSWSTTLTYQGQTVSIPLAGSPEERRGNFRRQLRQHIARCSRLGFQISFDPEWRYLDDFFAIYTETMARNRADDSFFYSLDYFWRLKTELADRASLVVATLNEEVVSAGLIFEYNGMVHPHLAGTKSTHLRHSPLKLLLSALSDWASERGNRLVHLGGGRGASDDDDLFRFKSEFSEARHRFYSTRLILDQTSYEDLRRSHVQNGRTHGKMIVDTGYFPAYRAPLQAVEAVLNRSDIGSRNTTAAAASQNTTIGLESGRGACGITSRRVLVAGSSGHARVVIDILSQTRDTVVSGIVDSYASVGSLCAEVPVLGSERDLLRLVLDHGIDGVVVAIGDNYVRMQMADELRRIVPGIRFVNAIHPMAYVAANVRLGEGVVIMAGAVVNSGCAVKNHCVINTNASLDHDSVMEAYSSLAPNSAAGGNVVVGEFTAISMGVNVIHGISIGAHTVVGAGAAVVRDLPSHVVAVGVPARPVRSRQTGERYL